MSEVEAVPDLYRLAYMPGQFRCPQCAFEWSIQTINVARGEIGTTEADRQTPDCPNDGTRMVMVTYREQLEAYADRLTEELDSVDRLQEFKKSVDKAVTVAFLSMTDDLGATDPREAIEHIRREFRDAEMKFQQKLTAVKT